MTQPTAVVLDSNRYSRNEICKCFSHCGVLPVCFDDEWICLENILHVRPLFVVVRPTSSEMAVHFVYIARAIERTLPIFIASDQSTLQGNLRLPGLDNLYTLSLPMPEHDLRQLIESLDGAKPNQQQSLVIAESPVARQCFDRLPRIARSCEPLLIQGEPGVGKRLIARTVHNYGCGTNRPWNPVSARDISGSWVRGLFRQIDRLPRSTNPSVCHLIENIDQLNDQMQLQLLLIMDAIAAKDNGNGTGMPIRFIFSTEADLSRLCQSGLFRKDLYYRLTVLKMHVPPLRDRKEDVALLSDFFAAKYGMVTQRALVRLPEKIRAAFHQYHWPGNVAELEETIKMAVAKGADRWGGALNQWCRDHTGGHRRLNGVSLIDIDDCLQKLMDGKTEMSLKLAKQRCALQVETNIIKTALFRTHGNRKQAARLLNISYKSMLNKVKALRMADGSTASL